MSFICCGSGSYFFGFFLTMLFILAIWGFFVGFLLAEAVNARVMLVGSVVYWVVASFIWSYVGLPSENLFWSMILVLFVDVTYRVRCLKKRRNQSWLRQACFARVISQACYESFDLFF